LVKNRNNGALLISNFVAFVILSLLRPIDNIAYKQYVKMTAVRLLMMVSKAVPSQAWSGPEGSRKLRFPDFMTTAHDGGKVVSLTHRPPLPQEIKLVLISVGG
jgi:hypothetical protein